MPRPSVTAIVVTYNSANLIEQCLDNALEAGVDRIVIWDNGSQDNTAAINRRYEQDDRVTVVESTDNKGFGQAVNAAARTVVTDLILLLNPDCLLNGDCLHALTEAMSSDPSIAATAPRMRYEGGAYGISGGGDPSLLKEVVSASGVYRRLGPRAHRALRWVALRVPNRSESKYLASTAQGRPIELEWLSGFCLLIRRSAWERVGGFDDQYFMYFEDVALGRALRSLGYRMLCVRNADALHFESKSSTKATKGHLYSSSRDVYFREHGSKTQKRAFEVAKQLGLL